MERRREFKNLRGEEESLEIRKRRREFKFLGDTMRVNGLRREKGSLGFEKRFQSLEEKK